MENQARSTHPMIVVAATAVTIASLAAIASIAGWIPGKSEASLAAPTAQVASAPATAVPPATPEPTPVVAEPAAPVAAPSAPAKAAPAHKAAPRKTTKEADYAYKSSPSSGSRVTTPVDYPMNDSGVYVENSRQQPQYAQNTQGSNTCHDCATVESVREIKQEDRKSGV